LKTIKNKENKIRINEIFYSIQGESTYAGLPCVFVRLTYCNLRCTYCDTEYAFYEGNWKSFDEIIEKIKSYNCNLVEVTGGEPLLQDNVHPLMKRLCDEGFEVLLETAGHMDINIVDPRVKRIMDIKGPSSNEAGKTLWENINYLNKDDQVKFVVGDREDFDFANEIIKKYNLDKKCTLLISPLFGKINMEELANWILDEKIPVRLQVQMHKLIWDPQTRGV